MRKIRGRGRPERLGARIRPDYHEQDDEAITDRERVVPRAARERSDQARSREEAPAREVDLVAGEVVAFRGLFADVLAGGEVVRCTLRGRLETADTEDRVLLAVGDRVEFESTGEREGVIERMLPRRNVLLRAAPGTRQTAGGRSRHPRFRHVIAANVDRILLITSVAEPRFRPGIVDRFLVAASSQELPASLVVNKVDLAGEAKARAELDEYTALYAQLGVRVILTSAVTGTGLAEFEATLRQERTVLVGHSGVGKTTLLNAIDPELKLPARPVNRKTGKGTHTTSVARLLRLPSGVEVIDTPGVRELDIIGLGPSNLEAHMPEFVELMERCEMDNCSHREEPGCAVKAGVESGDVHPKRYESYLALFEALLRTERPYSRAKVKENPAEQGEAAE
ncbi:MAG: ribosome small subunit-dependent GTPase A [Planctomycetota bacterium]